MQIRDHRLILANGNPAPFQNSPNQGGALRHEYLVMHFTAGRSAASSISWLCNPQARASAHVVIGRDGAITQLVPFNRVAWHAGRSRWAGLDGLNQYAIGIELDNAGKLTQRGGRWVAWFGDAYPDEQVVIATHKNESSPAGWHGYTSEQLEAAAELGALLIRHYGLRDVIGHDDISPGRKNDPGPAFPMESFRSRVMGRSEDELEYFETTTDLNIRSGAGTQYPTIIPRPLPPGTRVLPLQRGATWWLVDVEDTVDGENDLQGWVHSGWLRPSGPSPAGLEGGTEELGGGHFGPREGPVSPRLYVTAYNYADNSPAFSDFVARGRHQGGGGAPPHDFRADIGRNNFANPSSIAVSPEAGLSFGSRVFIEGYGWFLVEDRTQAGLPRAPRFDVWTAGATQAELAALTGWREVTVFPAGQAVPPEWQHRTASPLWNWQLWTSEARVAPLRNQSRWYGLYVEGQLRM